MSAITRSHRTAPTSHTLETMPEKAHARSLTSRLQGLRKLDAPTLRISSASSAPLPTAEHMLVVDSVHKEFHQDGGEVRGLHGVSFTMRAGEFAFITGPTGHGKAQSLHAPVLTPTGWTTMGRLALGDEVIAGDGTSTSVIGIFPQGEQDIYRITFSDGAQAECTADHLWRVRTRSDEGGGSPWCVMSLRQIMDGPLPSSRWLTPIVDPVRFEPGSDDELPLDGYVVGALLGDGGLTEQPPLPTTADDEVTTRIAALLPPGVEVRSVTDPSRSSSRWRLTICPESTSSSLTTALSELDSTGRSARDKAVPKRYLWSSIHTRLAVLQGLCDTNGHAVPGNRVALLSPSKQLADDVTFLARSLGGTARVRPEDTADLAQGERRGARSSWIVTFRLPASFTPFTLTRKRDVHSAHRCSDTLTRAISRIERVGRAHAQCIQVAHPDQLYVTSDFVVTHNTTLLRLIRNQIQPDSGTIYLGEEPISRFKPRAYKRKVGFVSQTLDTLPLSTVVENIAMPLQYLRWSPDRIDRRVEELLDVFSLRHARNRLCNDEQLSGGERQRLAIARAIAHQPDLLLCDEPTGNLDEQTTYGVLRTLNRISMLGTTVLCVTHDPQVVDLMKKRVIVVRSGQISSDAVGGYRLL